MVKDAEGSLVNFAHRRDPMDAPLQPVLVNVGQNGKATVGARYLSVPCENVGRELKGHMARGRVDYRQPPCRFHYWTTRDFAKGRNEIKTSVASSAKLPRQKSDTSCINLRCIASVSLLVSTSSLCRSLASPYSSSRVFVASVIPSVNNSTLFPGSNCTVTSQYFDSGNIPRTIPPSPRSSAFPLERCNRGKQCPALL